MMIYSADSCSLEGVNSSVMSGLQEEEVQISMWNGRLISYPHLSNEKGKAKAAIGFTTIVGGIILICLPIPGSATVGIGLIIKGGIDAAQAVSEKEVEIKGRGSNHPHPSNPSTPSAQGGVGIGF